MTPLAFVLQLPRRSTLPVPPPDELKVDGDDRALLLPKAYAAAETLLIEKAEFAAGLRREIAEAALLGQEVGASSGRHAELSTALDAARFAAHQLLMLHRGVETDWHLQRPSDVPSRVAQSRAAASEYARAVFENYAIRAGTEWQESLNGTYWSLEPTNLSDVEQLALIRQARETGAPEIPADVAEKWPELPQSIKDGLMGLARQILLAKHVNEVR